MAIFNGPIPDVRWRKLPLLVGDVEGFSMEWPVIRHCPDCKVPLNDWRIEQGRSWYPCAVCKINWTVRTYDDRNS